MGCGGSKKEVNGASQDNKDAFQQSIVILRHSERRDQMDKMFLTTEEHLAWPFDTPLTENGVQLAKTVAGEIAEINGKAAKGAQFSMVVSSPYRRCMQTAAEVAKKLNLPVIIDQEVGEVRDAKTPPERPPHRTPVELVAMAKELGIEVKNPMLPEGGFRMFGKVPKYPEDLKDGHQRATVRVEHYIKESAENKKNYIVVSHAPAVAAMMDIFEHGMCEVDKLDYCAMVCATRKIDKAKVAETRDSEHSVFVEQWQVDSSRISAGVNLMGSEDEHKEYCQETTRKAKVRKDKDTLSDKQLASVLKGVDPSLLQKDQV